MPRVFRCLAALCLLACGRSDQPPAAEAVSEASATTTPAVVRGGPGSANACPADGLWAPCSVVYRLTRAGVAPRVDSTANPAEAVLGGTPLMLRIGLSATLEVHLYPDSAHRRAAAARLDRSQFVNGTQAQTIRRERTLVESANLIGFLTSLNSRQRERVWDALAAGPPQP